MKSTIDDMRRNPRLAVCCRAVVHDRYGVWTGVTDSVSARGCRIVTQRMLRAGSSLSLTLSSDLFPQDLDVGGHAVWASCDRVAVIFSSAPRPGSLSPAEWFSRLLEVGASDSASRVVPSIRAVGPRLLTPVSASEGSPQIASRRPVLRATPDAGGPLHLPFARR